jgi:small-conductance mechanosensitive channel
LRVAILKALNAAGIEIPFNQIDINLRDLETIKAHLAAILEQPSNGAARQGRPHIAAGSPQAKRSDES